MLVLYISFLCLSKMLPRNDTHFATCNSIPKMQQASNLIPRALKTIIGNYSSSIKSAAHSHSKLRLRILSFDLIMMQSFVAHYPSLARSFMQLCGITNVYHFSMLNFYQSPKTKPIKDSNMFPTCGSKQIKHLSQVLQT